MEHPALVLFLWRFGLTLAAVKLVRDVTEEQRSRRPIFIATLRAARLLTGCFVAHREKTTAGILPLRFAPPVKIRSSATTAVTDLVHKKPGLMRHRVANLLFNKYNFVCSAGEGRTRINRRQREAQLREFLVVYRATDGLD